MTTLLTGGGTRGSETLDDDVDLARDRALVTRAQAGERAAFDDLYVRYYRRLYRFCLRRLHDSHEAEDVAQEAFARAWRALPTFGGDRRFYPWLSVIASHLCTDVLRRRNRSTPVAEFHQSNLATTEDGGEEVVVAAVDSALVAKAFTRLSDRHQRILHLREGSGWSYQRIADHEGVGITAVETLLWRARQALKREFASLAGAEGRMGAFVGGLLSLASLRRLLGLPTRVLRKMATSGAKGATLAAGSAMAATAMIVGAALSPVPAVITPSSSHAGALSGGGESSIPLAPITGLPLVPLGTSGSSSAGPAAKGGSSTGLPAVSLPQTPNLPVGGGIPLGGLPGANLASGTLQQVSGTLQQVSGALQQVSGALNQLNGTLNQVGGTLNQVGSTLGPVGSTLGPAASQVTNTLGQALSTVTNTLGQTVGGVEQTLQQLTGGGSTTTGASATGGSSTGGITPGGNSTGGSTPGGGSSSTGSSTGLGGLLGTALKTTCTVTKLLGGC